MALNSSLAHCPFPLLNHSFKFFIRNLMFYFLAFVLSYPSIDFKVALEKLTVFLWNKMVGFYINRYLGCMSIELLLAKIPQTGLKYLWCLQVVCSTLIRLWYLQDFIISTWSFHAGYLLIIVTTILLSFLVSLRRFYTFMS